VLVVTAHVDAPEHDTTGSLRGQFCAPVEKNSILTNARELWGTTSTPHIVPASALRRSAGASVGRGEAVIPMASLATPVRNVEMRGETTSKARKGHPLFRYWPESWEPGADDSSAAISTRSTGDFRNWSVACMVLQPHQIVGVDFARIGFLPVGLSRPLSRRLVRGAMSTFAPTITADAVPKSSRPWRILSLGNYAHMPEHPEMGET